jgi:hypothetical protein
MAYEKRPGDISIFKNHKKVEGSKQPDYTGELLTPEGEVLRISLWTKEGKGGGKFLAGSVQKPFNQVPQAKINNEEFRYGGSPNPTYGPAKDVEDGSLPF